MRRSRMQGTVCCLVLSLTVEVIGRGSIIEDPVKVKNFKAEKYQQHEFTEKPWKTRQDVPENSEEPDFEAIRKYVNHVAYMYEKTKYLLTSLKNTIHTDLSNAVDDLGRSMDATVNRKISYIRPFLKSLMRANSRSLLGNMMKRIMHRQG